MLIFENGGWQTSSESADTNYLEGIEGCIQPKWVVPDNSEVAAKVMSAVRPWEPVEDENGNLIDITEIPLSQEELNQQRIGEIKQQLNELDAQAVRPLRAIAAGTATDADTDKLRETEAQAEVLRAELAELEGGE